VRSCCCCCGESIISVRGTISLIGDGDKLAVGHQDPCSVLVLVLGAQYAVGPRYVVGQPDKLGTRESPQGGGHRSVYLNDHVVNPDVPNLGGSHDEDWLW